MSQGAQQPAVSFKFPKASGDPIKTARSWPTDVLVEASNLRIHRAVTLAQLTWGAALLVVNTHLHIPS